MQSTVFTHSCYSLDITIIFHFRILTDSSRTWILFIIGLILLPTASPKVIQRINYGVLFKPARAQTVTFGVDNWIHTFELALPIVPAMPANVHCQHHNDTCAFIQQIIQTLNQIKAQTASNLNNTNIQIKKLIPEITSVTKVRSKRAILGFIGQISRSLFGTATVKDVDLLAKHINALSRQNHKIAQELTQHADHFSSFMSTVDHRINNAILGIKQNHDAIVFATNNIQTTYNNMRETFVAMSHLLTDQMQQATVVNAYVEDLKLGIHSLVQNKLSPLIVPPHTLQRTLHQIHNLITRKYPQFKLLQPHAQYYYSNAQFILSRNRSKLYISLKVPIISNTHHLNLYEIVSLPVPINASSSHVTQLLDLQQYFAISHDHQHYVSFNFKLIQNCEGIDNLYCVNKLALSAGTVSSCELSLFLDDKHGIRNLCNFRFRMNSLPSTVLELTPSSVILYNTPLIAINCASGQRMVFLWQEIQLFLHLLTLLIYHNFIFTSTNSHH
ncbi:uncharacterized protein LOC130013243 [Patella vulgata]|uniref:uncharacterized protein LOC130013243 n=1 Tax=Patella vulgata TaxID=6465 RepID=UPI0024A8C00C|nr:uncharacterized protein LOC130013243 [Patella vulgata]